MACWSSYAKFFSVSKCFLIVKWEAQEKIRMGLEIDTENSKKHNTFYREKYDFYRICERTSFFLLIVKLYNKSNVINQNLQKDTKV